jgi:hypothetical protein
MPDCTKLTETVFRRIVESVRKGMTFKLAAMRSKIDPRTLRLWLAKGRSGEDEACVSLFTAVTEAQALYVEDHIEVINTECKTDGKLALEMLARLHPEEYGSDKQRMKHIERRIAELEKQQGKPDA